MPFLVKVLLYLLKQLQMLEQFSKIKAIVLDIDGVLTNSQVFLLPDGTQMRNMHIKDGYAIQLAVKKGYHIGIISGGSSEESKQRLQGLGVEHIYLKTHDKLDKLKELMHIFQVQAEELLYMGDDIPDYECVDFAGVGATPENGAEEIKKIANYISAIPGGMGCVRDVIEKVMKIQGKWFDRQKLENDFKW